MSNDEIRKAGLKVTAPRVKILDLFEKSERRHLSAEDVYKLLLATGDDVAIATIYRVLTQFEQAGILCKHSFEDGRAVFELNEGEHHDHLVCVKCGKVEEFVDSEIERRQEAIAEQYGYQITDHVMTIYGLCQSCLTK